MATAVSGAQHASDEDRLTRRGGYSDVLDKRRRDALAQIDKAEFSYVFSSAGCFSCLLTSTQVVSFQSVRCRWCRVFCRCVSPTLPSPNPGLLLIFSAKVMIFSRMHGFHDSAYGS
jgi:hypothetical protein